MSKLLPCTGIITEIAKERRRQMEVEGWTPGHDDAHTDGSLAQAAACYAKPPALRRRTGDPRVAGVDGWPKSWHPSWWKPKGARRDLIRAAALIVAEIERLDRAQERASNARSSPGGATEPATGTGAFAAPVHGLDGPALGAK